MDGILDPLTTYSVNCTKMFATLSEHLYFTVPAVPRI